MTFSNYNPIEVKYLDWINKTIEAPLEYDNLLLYLYNKPFEYTYEMDANRASDGRDLRYRFGYFNDVTDSDIDLYLNKGSSSVLEMMVALAIRCENDIMHDPEIGDRTPFWFWGMIFNLGLNVITNEFFNPVKVDDILERLKNREYDKNGKGGLFTVNDTTKDMRTAEIWYQMSWYLDEIIYG